MNKSNKKIIYKKSIIYNDLYISFINKLKLAREQSNFSQSEVSRMFGKSRSFLFKIESCRHKIDAFTFWILAKIYKKPIEYFFQDLETKNFDEIIKILSSQN